MKESYYFEKHGIKTYGFEYLFLSKKDFLRTIAVGTAIFLFTVFVSKVWLTHPVLTTAFYFFALIFPYYGYRSGDVGTLTIALSSDGLGCAAQYSTSYVSRSYFELTLDPPLVMKYHSKKRLLIFEQNRQDKRHLKLPRNLSSDLFLETIEELSANFRIPLVIL